jgi:hypothetical protein
MTDVLSWRIPRLFGAAFLGATVFGLLMPILLIGPGLPHALLNVLIIPGLFGIIALTYWLMHKVGGPGEPAGPVALFVAKGFASLVLGNWLYSMFLVAPVPSLVPAEPLSYLLTWPANWACIGLVYWTLSKAYERRIFG